MELMRCLPRGTGAPQNVAAPLHIAAHTTIQTFGLLSVCFFLSSLLCSARLHLFDQKHRKNDNAMKMLL